MPRCSGPAGPGLPGESGAASRSVELGPTVSSWARARCNRLLTAVVVVPIAAATSAECHCRTSRSSSTARCRGERCCSAATNANRTDSRDSTMADGSAGSSAACGSGCSQGTSRRSTSFAGRVRAGTRRARSATDGARGPPARSGRCWWRCGAARCVGTTCLRTGRRPSRPAATSPAPGPPRRAGIRSSGSSVRAVRDGTARRQRRNRRQPPSAASRLTRASLRRASDYWPVQSHYAAP